MNKSELISAMAAEAGLSKAKTKRALDAFIASVTKALKAGDKVALVGFGTFSVTERAGRVGINPATKKPIQIPAKKVAKFRAGSELTIEKVVHNYNLIKGDAYNVSFFMELKIVRIFAHRKYI